MKTLHLLISAVAIALGTVGCATHTGGARSSGYDSPPQVWSPYGSKVGH